MPVDLFRKWKSLFSTTSNTFGTGTGVTITPNSVAGLPTDTMITLTFDREVAGKIERIIGHISGGNVVVDERGADGTTEQAHTTPTVECVVNARDWNDMIDGFLEEHTQTGAHSSALVTTLKATGSVVDTGTSDVTIVTPKAIADATVLAKLAGTQTFSGVKTFSADPNLSTGVNIQVNGADPKRGIYVPASAMYPSTTAGCAALAQVESSTNKVNIKVLDFDGAGSSKEFAEFGIPSPLYWDASTVTAQFVWYATAGSGTVNWELQGGAFSDDDALDAAYGTLQEVTDTLLATGDVHITDATAAITIAGTPVAGDWVQFRVARDPANDTNTSDARLMGVIIRFTVKQYNDA